MSTLSDAVAEKMLSEAVPLVQRMVKGIGYNPVKVITKNRYWLVYLPNDKNLNKQALERKFKPSQLQVIGYGWEKGIETGYYMAVALRGGSKK